MASLWVSYDCMALVILERLGAAVVLGHCASYFYMQQMFDSIIVCRVWKQAHCPEVFLIFSRWFSDMFFAFCWRTLRYSHFC